MTRKQRRLTMIGGSLAVLAVAAALVLNAMRDSIVFFSRWKHFTFVLFLGTLQKQNGKNSWTDFRFSAGKIETFVLRSKLPQRQMNVMNFASRSSRV